MAIRAKKRKKATGTSHTSTAKKKKTEDAPPTRVKTVKKKLTSAKKEIRRLVGVAHTIRVQTYLFLNWLFETQNLKSEFAVTQQFLVQLQKCFIMDFKFKDRTTRRSHNEDLEVAKAQNEVYDENSVRNQVQIAQLCRWFKLFESTYPIHKVKACHERVLEFQARTILTSLSEFYRLDDNVALYTRRIHPLLWALLHKKWYQCTTSFYPLTKKMQEAQTLLDQAPLVAAAFFIMRQHQDWKLIKDPRGDDFLVSRVHYLKFLRPLSKQRYYLSPKASLIPGHIHFDIDRVKWLKDFGFKDSFKSDGYSYCVGKEIEDKRTHPVPKDTVNLPNPKSFDRVYGCDPGVKIPICMATTETETHFDNVPATLQYLSGDVPGYISTQAEWGRKIGTDVYQAFYAKRTARIKPIFDELADAEDTLKHVALMFKHFSVLMYEFGHCDYRQWRFRRYGMKQRSLEMVVQHLEERATKDEDVYYEVIEGQSRLESMKRSDDTTLDAAKRRRWALRGRRTKKVLVYWGDGNFSHTFQGNPTSSCHQIRDYLLKRSNIKVVMTNESGTSKACLVCEENYTTGLIPIGSYRLRMCTHCLSDNRPCFSERDFGSAKFILKRGLDLYYEMESQLVGVIL